MHHRWTAALAALAGLAASGAQAHTPKLPHPDKIVIVMMENKDYGEIVGSANAPFINNSLIKGGLLYSNSHAIEHPSQPNYLDFFSGSNQGVNSGNGTLANKYNFPAKAAYYDSLVAGCLANPTCSSSATLAALQGAAATYHLYASLYGTLAVGDAFPNSTNFNIAGGAPFTTDNLAAELRSQGKSFVEYSDGLAAAGGADGAGNSVIGTINNPADPFSVGYAHRHDPVADWMSATPTGNQLPNTAEQDFANFGAGGVDFSSLPDVSFIVPDTIHDMHDGAVPTAVAKGDAWLAGNLANYLAWAKTHNSLLIFTTDENDFVDPSNQILTVINGDKRLFRPGVSNQDFNHFDVLRTLEDIYGTGYAGASAQGSNLWAFGGRFAGQAPEPATWATMLAGLGLAGATLRRGRRKAAVAA